MNEIQYRDKRMFKLDSTNIEDLKKILVEENIKIIDEESEPGEIEIENNCEDENNFSIYVKIDKDNNSLRIYGMSHSLIMRKKTNSSYSELLEVVNMMNLGSSIIKYSLVSKGTITFEYGIPLSGEVSDSYLRHVINFVLEEISVLGSIFDEFLKIVRKLKK